MLSIPKRKIAFLYRGRDLVYIAKRAIASISPKYETLKRRYTNAPYPELNHSPITWLKVIGRYRLKSIMAQTLTPATSPTKVPI
jgi:VanZ family protein